MSRLAYLASKYEDVQTEKVSEPLTFTQKQRLLDNFTLEELCRLLQKDQIFLSDITRQEYNKIIMLKLHPEKLRMFCLHHPVEISEGYEYGWQESRLFLDNKMWYVCFSQLFMADIDSLDQLDIIRHKLISANLSARIYSTHKGLHVFVTSERISHTASRCADLSDYLGSDVYYKLFSQRYGYKVRLNAKLGRTEAAAAVFLEKIGDAPELDDLVDLLHIHDSLIAKHAQIDDETV